MIDEIEESTDPRECPPPRPIRKSQTHQRQALPPKVEDEDFDFEADFGAATGGMTVKSDREKAEAETAAAAAAATAAAAGGGAATRPIRLPMRYEGGTRVEADWQM